MGDEHDVIDNAFGTTGCVINILEQQILDIKYVLRPICRPGWWPKISDDTDREKISRLIEDIGKAAVLLKKALKARAEHHAGEAIYYEI